MISSAKGASARLISLNDIDRGEGGNDYDEDDEHEEGFLFIPRLSE
jgi:hypothetical protein